jgi:hypothetical protein
MQEETTKKSNNLLKYFFPILSGVIIIYLIDIFIRVITMGGNMWNIIILNFIPITLFMFTFFLIIKIISKKVKNKLNWIFLLMQIAVVILIAISVSLVLIDNSYNTLGILFIIYPIIVAISIISIIIGFISIKKQN